MPKYPPDELYRRSLGIHWFHSVPLGGGLSTPGTKSVPLQQELLRWKFPTDLTGKSVLDIGCNDGGYTVTALQRGASRVLAIDANVTDGMRFLVENEVHPFEFRQMDLFSDEFLDLPAFDFVIFCGVLYHVKDPMEALRRVRKVTQWQALIETHIDERVPHLPCMMFYEHNELNNDGSNWWGPNRLCLDAMLRTVGFTVTQIADWQFHQKKGMGRIAYLAAPV